MRHQLRIRSAMVISALTCAALVLQAGTALAAGTLDQQNPGPSNAEQVACGGAVAQTFTAGLTGALDTVELLLSREGASGDVHVSIEGTGGLVDPAAPDAGNVLASETIPEADLGQPAAVQTIAFTSPPAIQAGTAYAIVVSDPDCVGDVLSENVGWTFVSGNPYSGGVSCWSDQASPDTWHCGETSNDQVFATYVTVTPPPPSADIRVAMSPSNSAPSGSQVSYLITVSNVGPDTAHNVVLTNALPGSSKLVGVTSTRGTCSPSKGKVTCALGDLATDDSATSVVTIKLTVTAGSIVTDLASAYSTTNGSGSATADPDTSNNVASATTTVTSRGGHGH